MKNNTWFLTDLPPSVKPIVCKWILKRKLNPDGSVVNPDGSVDKYKARLVVKEFSKKKC